MLQRFVSHIAQQHLFPTGQEVLLAVSGGVDSVVLAHLMYAAGYPFSVAHCNFHLRPCECDRDEAFVCRLAAGYGVECHVAQFDTLQFVQEQHLGIEEAARKLRYQWFDALCREHGYPVVLTAHHRDDAVETFFLNLLRGTGLSGLHGILPVQGRVVRPLLPFGREDILHYAGENHLSYVEDSTNASLDYRRNQIRHQLMPLLRQIQPSADSTISITIGNLQSVERHYQQLLEPLRQRYVQDDGETVRVTVKDFLPDDRQLLFELLRPYGFNIQVVADILEARQTGSRFFSVSHQAFLDRGVLVVASKPQPSEKPVAMGSDEGESNFFVEERVLSAEEFASEGWDVHSLPAGVACFDADSVQLPLLLRHWHSGDRFQPLGMSGKSQLVSDFFSDHKFSLVQKQRQLLLLDATGRILWIVDQRTSHPFRLTEATERILICRVTNRMES